MASKKATRPRASKANTSSKAMGSVSNLTSASAVAESSPSTTTADPNTPIIDEPVQAGDFVAYDNNKSLLLTLPNEVKQRIWKLAVAVDSPIFPRQIRERSNKFIWSKDQVNKKTHEIEIDAVPQLTVVQLARVCRAIYHEVATTHLFYNVNDFHFMYGYRGDDISIYLVAITEPRRSAIRSIRVPISWQMSVAKTAQLYTLITACQGLQFLHLEYKWRFFPGTFTHSGMPGFKECLVAVQGLKRLCVSIEDIPSAYGFPSSLYGTNEQRKSFSKEIEAALQERLSLPRSKTYDLAKFRQAQIDAKLDVHGEGRLSDDKRPGLVSSRTRQQVRNIENIAADGTFPVRESPKYDLNGDLAWAISAVHDSREAALDGMQSVEFLVKGGPAYHDKYWSHIPKDKETKFWEDVTVLNSLDCRCRINTFYEANPKAYGAQIVLGVWRLRKDEIDGDKKISQTEKYLETTIARHAKAEKKEADEAARKKREAAKAAKAAKAAAKSGEGRH